MWFALACAESMPSWSLPVVAGRDSAPPATSADSGDLDDSGEPADSGTTPADSTAATTGGSGDSVDSDAATTPSADPCAESWGSLAVGEEHEIGVDGHSGDEESTEPKEDANDGLDGDEPSFQRHNVARAHCTSRCYWYSSSHQESGEPDPEGEQWVDYVPDFAALGVGWYDIRAVYRQSDNRADYEAVYRIEHRDGSSDLLQDQREGSDYVEIDLGRWWMCPGSKLRVIDEGGESITFNEVEFERG